MGNLLPLEFLEAMGSDPYGAQGTISREERVRIEHPRFPLPVPVPHFLDSLEGGAQAGRLGGKPQSFRRKP